MSANTKTSPGRLLRLSLQIYANRNNTREQNEAFVREYLVKVATIHARNGIEMYQQVFSPTPLRKALDEMNRKSNRGWVVDDHDLTVEFYFRNFAALEKVRHDPEFTALQATEGPFVNSVHTVASLGWVEKYVDSGEVVNVQGGKSVYPGWAEMEDLSTA
ncbi:uncharacterized protein F4822DRAFT_205989 [Hypoxylon trugodes]|uniref:uncharacterized protein n=1 Tax=Hypoxylon trugodes TaxID=326681 RepID=UPI00219CF68E|nr:uncharacterized protein F4822DRAFT_205989 [Hypoxylon trugodes]KAI1389611.1 hypothetical protein F4822DRAFT_205989 [Hypoxylon trugodes]